HFIVGISVLRITREGFAKCIERGLILFVQIVAEPEHAIGVRILKIHAESGAGFTNGIVPVVSLVENERQPIMDGRKPRLELFRSAVFVKSAVPISLLLL